MTKTMFQLFGCALREGSEKEIINLDKDTLKKILKVSTKHDLAHLVAEGLDRNGLLQTDEISQAFLRQRVMAVYRYEQMQYEFERICKVLEEAKIEYIPLKGSVLRAYYPEPWMRTSCDIDILVKKEAISTAVKILREQLGYSYEGESAHDAQLWAPSGIHLELHFTLIEEYVNPSNIDVLKNVWNESFACDGFCFRKGLSDEFFYFYHIAHMAKHVLAGGCGIRPFMDLWILNHRKSFDKEKRDTLLIKGNLYAFAQAAELLAEVWFSGVTHTEITQNLEFYILHGGVYGNLENRNLVRRGRQGNKLNYWRYRLFMPYEELCCIYPRLIGRKWLYPFYTVKRWIKRLFQGRAGRSIREAKMATNLSTEKITFTKNLMRDLGLSE